MWNQTAIALGSGLLICIVGALIAIYGRIMAVHRTEYYRLRSLVKGGLESVVSKVAQHNHPWLLLEDPSLNGPIDDILRVMPLHKRIGFRRQWKKCRHDKETYDLTPREYQKSTLAGRRLITERLHKLMSKL